VAVRNVVIVGLVVGLLLAGEPLFGGGVRAQTYYSLGLGVVMPQDELSDVYDVGLTFRGQAGLSLAMLGAHIQTGVTSFSFADDVTSGDEEATVYHVGAGARLGIGFLWVGANGAYFFGDGEDGVGYFPEVGLKLWRLEVVADYRVDSDQTWLATRLAWRF
jgi:hypothetical protein